MKQQVLTEQLDSLFEQTTASHIAEVWVCVFSAPAHDYALRVVKETKHKNVRLVVSDFNFKFYGRFQVRQSAVDTISVLRRLSDGLVCCDGRASILFRKP